MADELEVGTNHVLARRFAAAGGGRAAATAFVAGLAGTALFVGSLLTAWLRTELDPPGNDSFVTDLGLEHGQYSVVYLIGVLGLLTMLGLVVVRPALAERLRFAATGLGVGVIAVVVALTIALTGYVEEQYFRISPLFFGEIPRDVQRLLDSAVFTPQTGVYLAGAAVVALVAGVWLAALPAVGGDAGQASGTGTPATVGYVLVPAYPAAPDASLQAAPSPASAVPVSPVPAPNGGVPAAPAAPAAPAPGQLSGPAEHWLSPVGRVEGLTVTPSGPIDSGSQADILRT